MGPAINEVRDIFKYRPNHWTCDSCPHFDPVNGCWRDVEDIRKCQYIGEGLMYHDPDEEDDEYSYEGFDDDGWLCTICGHFQEDSFHCDVCGHEPPWGCDCTACHDRYLDRYLEEDDERYLEAFP